jgi:hypothetical protein
MLICCTFFCQMAVPLQMRTMANSGRIYRTKTHGQEDDIIPKHPHLCWTKLLVDYHRPLLT